MPDRSLVVLDESTGLPSGVTRSSIDRELTDLIEGEVRFDIHDRMLYATDASIYQVPPIGVVIPKSIEDAERIVEYCALRGLPILPRGAGTSLAGQAINTAIVIDFSAYCHRILDIDVERRIAHVEPGVVLDQLNATLAPHGLMFGPDVATSTHATLGGMIGNNSAGAHSILYGRTVEHVIGLEVMSADGTRLELSLGASERDKTIFSLTKQVVAVVLDLARQIDARFPKILRHVDGYNLDLMLDQIRRSKRGTYDRVNLAQLFCGSEGTLGLTVGATLKLVEAPSRKGLAIIAFPAIEEALDAVTSILETKPSAVELIDDTIIRLAGRNNEYRRYIDLLPPVDGASAGVVLYVEYFADDDDELQGRFENLGARFRKNAMLRHTEPDAVEQAWKLRKAGEPLLHGIPGLRKPLTFIEDTAVDPAKLPEFVRSFREIVTRHGSTAAYFAHVSVGCLHIRPLINLRDPDDLANMVSIAEQVTDLVIEYGGALSGEHGDGRLRSHLLERFFGSEICEGFRKIKAIFDPGNRMNPGILVDPPAMDEQLRVRPDVQFIDVPKVDTYFRFEREEGLTGAVEMCNGAGMCRKLQGGTMCPSYRALRDERHATRGRANALRLAITGQFSAGGSDPDWNDTETLRTLDLCLSCKACKSECPSNVDVARLKSEYLAQGFRERGRIPRAARFFGRIRGVNRIGSTMPGLANALNGFGPIRSLINRLLNIAPQRSLPRFAPSLHSWFENRPRRTAKDGAPTVILFPDCFTIYNEPHIGRAAVQVLEGLGYRVVLPRLGCCGRSLISVGMLEEARRTCTRTARDLLMQVKTHDAVAVVGCEPSCISAITDDWLDLKMDVESSELESLAEHVHLIEDFIGNGWDTHPDSSLLDIDHPHEKSILVHGHCHQKALWSMDATKTLLHRLFGENVLMLDSGCCGMAGSFGFSRDRYDLSMKIFEQSLGGLLRDQPEAIVLAGGTSCRHQILDGLGRTALHPIELIHSALGGSPPRKDRPLTHLITAE